MKKRAEKNRLKWTLKTADIDSEKLSEGLGRCPKNPQGTSPLTHFRALPEPVLAGRQEKGAVAPFLLNRIIREPYVNRLSRHILTDGATVCSGIPRFYWQQLRSDAGFPFFCMFRIVCWPRKMRSCHLPGMLSAPCSISTSLSTLYFLCLCGRRKL